MSRAKKLMNQCLLLVEQALANGDPPVGAILVYEEQIIGQGIESDKSTNDITNHAEILAVKDVIARGHQQLLSQSTRYTTHEPCILCSYLIRHYKVRRIIIGLTVDYVGGFTSSLSILQTIEVPKWGPPPTLSLMCEGKHARTSIGGLSKKFSLRMNENQA